jgi:hypothetical protein
LERLERLVQFLQQWTAQSVQCFGAIQRDDSHFALFLHQNVFKLLKTSQRYAIELKKKEKKIMEETERGIAGEVYLQQKRGERSRPTMCEWFWRVW